MQAIKSSSYEFLKNSISSNVKILDLYVRNKWLCAELSSGVKFMVIN